MKSVGFSSYFLGSVDLMLVYLNVSLSKFFKNFKKHFSNDQSLKEVLKEDCF